MNTTGLSVAGGMEGTSGCLNAILQEYPNFTQPSPSSKLLFWTLNGPLESAIQIIINPYYEPGDPMEPYFRPAEAGGLSSGSWHPVSQESLMEPQVAALTVEMNQICTDIKTDTRRPRAQDVQIVVTPAHGGAFVTVHDYVSAVHPWLMNMRERLLDALGRIRSSQAWPPETRLAVLRLDDGPISIGNEDRWADSNKRPTPHREWTWAERNEDARKVMERAMARSAARVRELERLRQEEGN
ncbi:hypothetical protein CkaCkLH20_13289 [Colletotrichum karsti]|uniref:Uncharacterized protein n=1 Tax=Colletotrichum karsti TaxID=1095194 RepID=A0A9P6HSK1_9PEZI|nr:uncharacterized protein CkaCkLH20_13289 [Colletotrichum karsti]KAF9869244.1 hypothetical protein CkaCkLH20_13289 [Colletotrichum karsti]